MPLKLCIKCDTEKSLDDFYTSNQTKDGKAAYCKPCCRKDKKLFYQKNKEAVQSYVRSYRASNREKVNANLRRYYKENADILKAKKKIRYEENPKRFQNGVRASRLKSEYGLTIEKYDMMVIQQAGRCAICAGPPVHGKRLTIDHCHISGIVRGLLCSNCNVALGLLQEKELIVERALKYLRRSRPNTQSLDRMLAADRKSREKPRDRRSKAKVIA
jgi:hypothetical protein